MYRRLPILMLAQSAMFVGTIVACSAVNLPKPFASPTVSATASLTPTNAPTPSRTPRPTATATLILTPLPSNTSLGSRWDGSVSFTDNDGAYMLIVPAGWNVTRIPGGDLNAFLSEAAKTSRILADLLAAGGMPAAGTFRIVAYDERHEHQTGGIVPNLVVSVLLGTPPEDPKTLDLLETVMLLSLEKSYSGVKITKQLKSRINAHGLTVSSADIDMPLTSALDNKVVIAKRVAYIQAPGALVVLGVSSSQRDARAVFQDADKLIDSVQALPADK